jgi:glycosyltransferase involved in cell wall biosynthesis
MSRPLVTVVIPAYNRSNYIARAIQSVQDQSFQDFEILVVDDGSKDNTGNIVGEKASTDPRIKYLRHPVNRGAMAARNTGARAAQGEWVAFLDSDDEWLTNSLKLRLLDAEQRKVKVVHSECYIEYVSTKQRSLFGIRPFSGMVYQEFLRRPGPVFPALLVHFSALQAIDYLDESIVSYQEWDVSIRLAKDYEFGFVSEPTFIYYRHPDAAISYDMVRNARGYEQVVRKHTDEIISLLGRKALGDHYARAATFYLQGQSKLKARNCMVLALKFDPSRKNITSFVRSIFL